MTISSLGILNVGMVLSTEITWVSSLTEYGPSLLIAAALGHLLSLCYEWTYEGLSYSRRFVNSLTLSTLSACALMIALNAQLALGVGLIGAMAMLRYRVNARDLWEMSFIFASLVTGLATGMGRRHLAALFCIGFCLTATLLIRGGLGAKARFDGVIRFWLPHQDQHSTNLETLIGEFCSAYQLVALREGAQGTGAEVSYHISLKGRRGSDLRATKREELINALRDQLGAEEIVLMAQDHHLEL